MPQSTVDSFTNNLVDEEYLVMKSKEAFQRNPHLCKAWILTAKTLFPYNFKIQFEAYIIEKNNDNAKEAAKCFTTLFQSFISESGLWQEIDNLTNALRSETSNPETVFLRKMFSCIPPVTQHDILTVTAERSEDTMEHCRLILLLFHKFPQTTPQLILRLVDTLITAEKHGHCPSVMNCYRKTLVCDVLPLLLHANSDLPSKQLYRFLHKSTEFYFASLTSKNVCKNFSDEPKNDVSWESFYALLKLFGNKLDWELCVIFSYPWNKDGVWQHILTFSSVRLNALEPSKGVKQLIFCLTILFAYCLYQYNGLLQSNADNKTTSVLVEAFITNEIEETSIPKAKRLKIDSSDPNLPVLTGGDGTGDIIKHFNFALKCWSMLQSTETYQKEFSKLKQHIRLDSWLLYFTTDVALYRAKYEEFQSNVRKDDDGSIRSLIQKLTCDFILKNFCSIGECCIQVVKQLHTLHTIGSCSKNLSQLGVSRHLHYLPLTKVTILQYVVKLLIIMYKQMLPNVDDIETDRIYGYLLILAQLNWPTERRISLDVLSRIRNQRSFVFPLFFKYIVNVEILEEFMHMYANEQETIKLDLMCATQTSGQKRISTRGADKEERQDFMQMMKQQICRQEPLYTLIITFLLEEEKFVSLK